jgi:hypothetical protein
MKVAGLGNPQRVILSAAKDLNGILQDCSVEILRAANGAALRMTSSSRTECRAD